jgi:hypothetical protein
MGGQSDRSTMRDASSRDRECNSLSLRMYGWPPVKRAAQLCARLREIIFGRGWPRSGVTGAEAPTRREVHVE